MTCDRSRRIGARAPPAAATTAAARWRWRSPRAVRPPAAPDGEGALRGRGDAAGLLGRRREPARGEASGSRVGAGAGDGLALRRRRRGAHLRRAARRARPRSRATAAAASSGTRACPTTASGSARTARARPSAWAASARRAWRRPPPRPMPAGSAARAARRATPDRASASICRPTFPTGARAAGAAARCYDGPARRAVRTRRRGAHTLADACDPAHPCVDGSRCVEGGASPNGPRPPAGCRPTVPAAAAASAAASAARRMRPMLMARAGALAGAGALRRGVARLPAPRARAPPTACGSKRRTRRSGSTRPFRSRRTLDLSGAARAAGSPGARSKGPRCARWRRRDGGFELTARMPPLADVVAGPASLGRRPAVAADARRGRAAGDLDRRPGPHAGARGARRRRPPRRAACPTRRSASASTWAARAGTSPRARRAAPPRSTPPAASPACCPMSRATGGSRTAPGVTLALRSGRYDETPLDCGRAGCHPAITDAAATSPMTTVLARGLHRCAARRAGLSRLRARLPRDRRARASPTAASRTSCPSWARPGDLGRRWQALPRDLHRLGGVGCLACHGPGAIPEAVGALERAARRRLRRLSRCAAPLRPRRRLARNGDGARRRRPARARRARLRALPHDGRGFLETVSTPERQPVDRRTPDGVGPVGHQLQRVPRRSRSDSGRRRPARLLRDTPVPAMLAGTRGEASASPATPPTPPTPRPSASAAALWLGRGGLDPATGAPLTGAPLHAGIAGGCVGCHRAGPDDVERGAGHGFRAPASVCAPCHAQALMTSDVRARAGDAVAQPAQATSRRRPRTPTPPSASIAARRSAVPPGTCCWCWRIAARARTTPRYARALLDAAASVIEAGDGRKAR